MADNRIAGLNAITEINTALDFLPIVDVSDNQMAGSGTTKKITISQILGAGGNVVLPQGTAAAPAASFTGDGNTGIFSTGADIFGISVGGVTSATFSNTGLLVAGTVSGTQLISTVATGTAPLSITSTTLVTNLNADRVDGQDASYFLNTSSQVQTKSGALYVTDALASINLYGNFAAFQTAGGIGYRWTLNNDASFRLQHTTDGFSTVANPRIHVSSAGQIGIGVAPSGQGGGGSIQMADSSAILSQGKNFSIVTNGYFDTSWKCYANGNFTQYYASDGKHIWWNGSGTTTALTPVQAMTLDASGNLGVGTIPASWDSTFKSINVGINSAAAFMASEGATAYIGDEGYYNAGWKHSYAGVAATLYKLSSGIHDWYSANSGATVGSGIAYSLRMRLTKDGNLGIGTATPATKLHINGEVALPLNNLIYWNAYYGTGAFRSIASGKSGYIATLTDGSIQFSNTTASAASADQSISFTERLRIASDGVCTWSNVGEVAGTRMTLNATGLGVGVSPTVPLDVVGDAKVSGNLTVDTNTLVVHAANNFVGINTSTPIANLDVRASNGVGAVFLRTTDPSAAVASAYIQTPVSTGHSATSVYGFWYQNTGVANPSAETLAINTNATERLRLASDGVCTWSNVGGVAGTAMTLNGTGLGVGETSTGSKLHVKGTGVNIAALVDSSATGYSGLVLKGTGSQNFSIGMGGPSEAAFSVANKFFLYDGLAGAMRLAVDSSGNVGIGTASPNQKFVSAGPRSYFAGDGALYAIGVGSTTARTAANEVYYIGATNSATPDLVFTNAYAVEGMRITHSGNLGLGTSTANFRADIQNASGAAVLRLKGGTGAAQGSAVYMTYAGGANTLLGIGDRATILGGTPDQLACIYSGVPLTFEINGSERLRIDSSGNVVVGTASANGSLTVVGAQAVDGTTYYVASLAANNSPVAGRGSGLAFRTNVGSFTPVICAIEGVKENGTTDDYASALDFSTRVNGGLMTKRLRIDSTGNTILYQPLRAANGTASAPSISFDSDTNTGMYRFGADTLGFTTGGVPVFKVNSNGSFGYTTDIGGAVTQATSRTTGVTLNSPCGGITLVSAAGSTSWQTFTVTNSTVEATDVVRVCQKSGTDLYQIHVTNVSAGSFKVTFATTGGTTTEQPVFNFAVIKATAGNPV